MVLVSIAAIRHCAQNDCDLSDSLACIRIGSTLGSFFFFKIVIFFPRHPRDGDHHQGETSALFELSSLCLDG